MKKIGLLVFAIFSFIQVSFTTADYSEMSKKDLDKALIIAIRRNKSEEVSNLLQAGADGNQTITYEAGIRDFDLDITTSLLEYAVKYCNVEVVKNLLAEFKGDNINEILLIAVIKNCSAVVKELIEAGADVNYVDRNGRTALLEAANEARPAVARELITAGADVNYIDKYNNTALLEAVKRGCLSVVKELVKAGADVNYVNSSGNTALTIAVRKHYLKTTQFLLETPKININHANNDGNSVLMIALMCVETSYIVGRKDQYNDCMNSQKIIEILMQIPGINFNHVNKSGESVIKLIEKMKKKLSYY